MKKEIITAIQNEKFVEVTGTTFTFETYSGSFITHYPYNNRDWKYSPYIVNYIVEKETGNLICELSHRMTNNSIYGWDANGNNLAIEILDKHFKPDY